MTWNAIYCGSLALSGLALFCFVYFGALWIAARYSHEPEGEDKLDSLLNSGTFERSLFARRGERIASFASGVARARASGYTMGLRHAEKPEDT